jgi:hypothetical protein
MGARADRLALGWRRDWAETSFVAWEAFQRDTDTPKRGFGRRDDILDTESGRKKVSDNNVSEQKSILVVRAPLSSDGFVSIHFSSSEGRLMNEREWWHLKQVIELASRAFVKEEREKERASAAAA